MSETNEVFSTEKVTRNLDGEDFLCTVVTFGTVDKRRSVTVKDSMGPGSYLESLEVYGSTSSDIANSLAMLAFRCIELEGKPPVPFKRRSEVHQFLNRLGNDGVNAITRAYASDETTSADAMLATAGN